MTELFPVAELRRILGTHRKARLRALLDAQGVPYVLDARGWPLVYRDALRPGERAPAARFDFGRARA